MRRRVARCSARSHSSPPARERLRACRA
jgi:hypothetical protein